MELLHVVWDVMALAVQVDAPVVFFAVRLNPSSVKLQVMLISTQN